MNMELEIVSPTEVVAKDQGVTELIIPATWGQMDILPQHAEYMTTLAQGELIYKKGNEKRSFKIAGGLLTISHDKATVLIDGLLATVTDINEVRQMRKQ